MIKKTVMAVTMLLMAAAPAPLFCGGFVAGPWQPFYEMTGGAAYAFSPVGIVHVGDHVQVRVRAAEPTGAGKERVTTIVYELNCGQRTFRMLEVVEEHQGLRSVCTNPSDDFPIRPAKHPHLEKLHARVCP